MNLTDKYTKKTIQTPSSKNMTAIIIGGHTRSNGWTRCGAGMARMACEIRRIQCFGSSFRQLKELWGKRRYLVRMALSYLMAVGVANFMHARIR
jgi:hypothetical protein